MNRRSLFLFYIALLHISTASSYNIITLTNPKRDWKSFFQTFQQCCAINTFVETGTYLGDTTALAAEVFPETHTIELLSMFYEKAIERFSANPGIHVHLGDSTTIFPVLLPSLNTPYHAILFWLDGHIMDCQSTDEHEFAAHDYTPIMKELKTIKSTHLKNDILLIDDIRLFGSLLDNQRIASAGKIEYPLLKDVCSLLQDTYACKIFGDILLAYEKSLDLHFSPVIEACTISRMYDGTNYTTQEVLNAEQIIANTQGQELQALQSLYQDFSAPWKRAWYNKSPHYNLWYGLTLSQQGDYRNAILQFKEVIRLGYNHWRVYWYLGQSLYKNNLYNEATDALNIVLQKNSTFEPATALLSQIQTSAY